MKIERDAGKIVSIGDAPVSYDIVGGQWMINYILVDPGEVNSYRDALMRARANIIRVKRSEGFIAFED